MFVIKIYGKLYSLNRLVNYSILYYHEIIFITFFSYFFRLEQIYFLNFFFFSLIATTDQQASSFEMEMSQAGFSAHYSQVNKVFENRSYFTKVDFCWWFCEFGVSFRFLCIVFFAVGSFGVSCNPVTIFVKCIEHLWTTKAGDSTYNFTWALNLMFSQHFLSGK